MKRKGFTLTELLGVIVVLGIVLGLAVVGVTFLTNKGKDTAYKTDTTVLENAARNYLIDNIDVFSIKYGETKNISYNVLKTSGYINKDSFIDPNNGNCDDSYISVTKKQTTDTYNFDYSVCLICKDGEKITYQSEICKDNQESGPTFEIYEGSKKVSNTEEIKDYDTISVIGGKKVIELKVQNIIATNSQVEKIRYSFEKYGSTERYVEVEKTKSSFSASKEIENVGEWNFVVEITDNLGTKKIKTYKIVVIKLLDIVCNNYQYNGGEQLLTNEQTGITYQNNTAINVGTYTITGKLGAYYKLKGTDITKITRKDITETEVNKECEIIKREITVNWTNLTFTYDENSHIPSGSVTTGVTGEAMELTITGSGVNAGNYTATASCNKVTGGQAKCENYDLKSNSQSFVINRANFTCTASTGNYTYGETKSTPSVNSNPGSGSVTYYYNSSNSTSGGTDWTSITSTSKNAGTHYVYATISQTTNYNSATCSANSYTINRASMSIPGSPDDKTYNGNNQNSGVTCPGGSSSSGTTSAINADTYYHTCTPDANHQWSDGVTAAKSISWVIGKADAQNPSVGNFIGGADGAYHYISVSGGYGGNVIYSTDGSNWSYNNPGLTSGSTTVYVKREANNNYYETSATSASIIVMNPSLLCGGNSSIEIYRGHTTTASLNDSSYVSGTGFSSNNASYATVNSSNGLVQASSEQSGEKTTITATIEYPSNTIYRSCDVTPRKGVAQLNGVIDYGSLQTAVNNASTGEVKLLVNTTEHVEINNDKNISLNLNSKTLTGSIVNRGVATITNGTVTGSNCDHNYAWRIANYGTMTVDYVTIEHTGNASCPSYNGAPGCAMMNVELTAKLTFKNSSVSTADHGIVADCGIKYDEDYCSNSVLVQNTSVTKTGDTEGVLLWSRRKASVVATNSSLGGGMVCTHSDCDSSQTSTFGEMILRDTSITNIPTKKIFGYVKTFYKVDSNTMRAILWNKTGQKCPTWTIDNGQDDLEWYTPVTLPVDTINKANTGKVLACDIKKSNHGNSNGPYNTHFYDDTCTGCQPIDKYNEWIWDY